MGGDIRVRRRRLALAASVLAAFVAAALSVAAAGAKARRQPPAASAKGDITRQTIGDFAYGSTAVLNRCWSQQELLGESPAEKLVHRPSDRPYPGPPRSLQPRHQRPPLEPQWRGSIRRVVPRGGEKLVALTFDLCERERERAGYDAPLVAYLRAQHVPATFFVGGKWMQSHAERAMQLMADPLFEIGHHGWTHGNCRVLKGRRLREQIVWTEVEYERLRAVLAGRECARAVAGAMDSIPQLPLTFRFPYGACSDEALEILAERGMPAIQWNVVTGDPAPRHTAQETARTVLAETVPGSIVIMHANGRGHGTAEALPLLVPRLRERGYRFVTVTQLLGSGKPVIARECYELRPGDNLRYDRIFGDGTQ